MIGCPSKTCKGFGILPDVLRACKRCTQHDKCIAEEKMANLKNQRFKLLEKKMDLLKELFRSLTDELSRAGFVFAEEVANKNNIEALIRPTENKKDFSALHLSEVDLKVFVPDFFVKILEYFSNLVYSHGVDNRVFTSRNILFKRGTRLIFTLSVRGTLKIPYKYLDFLSPPFAFSKSGKYIEARVFDVLNAKNGEDFNIYTEPVINEFVHDVIFIDKKMEESGGKIQI